MEACKPSGKHREGDESLCTLEAFKEVVEKIRPGDWSQECRLIGNVLEFQANRQKRRKLQRISWVRISSLFASQNILQFWRQRNLCGNIHIYTYVYISEFKNGERIF
jgi:hypothetical protein